MEKKCIMSFNKEQNMDGWMQEFFIGSYWYQYRLPKNISRSRGIQADDKSFDWWAMGFKMSTVHVIKA